MVGGDTASEPSEDDVTAVVRFPVGDLDGVVDVELPDELADEFRRTLSDHGLTPITRIWESADPATATVIAATITGSAQIFAAVLTVFLTRATAGRRTDRRVRIETRADGSQTIELSGHTAPEEERLLETLQQEVTHQENQNRERHETLRRLFNENAE